MTSSNDSAPTASAPAAKRSDLEIKDAQLIFDSVWRELEKEFGHDNLRFPKEIILLGGDADTTAAILGGLAGAACGADQIPYEWSRYMAEIPRDEEWQGTLGRLLFGRFWLQHEYPEEYQASWNNLKSPPELRWMLALRNPFFLAVVLSHGFRRLLPPY